MPEKKIHLTRSLLSWYRKNSRDLPWRKTTDPYKIWVSEVMLQQTTVKAVIGYFTRWCRHFPTVTDLSNAPLQEVLKAWQGLGYYNRARNLHASARIVVDKYGGRVPDNLHDLSALPGFGPYTTAAVLSIAYGRPLPVVDANVRRVFQRIMAIQGPDAWLDKKIVTLLSSLISKKEPGDFNQALMELGALICRPKEPTCNVCPVRLSCKAYQKGIQELIPRPKLSRISVIHAVVAVIEDHGKFLIQKRPSSGLLAGLWEFPGGKVENSDSSAQKALIRELSEELGCSSIVRKRLGRVVHYYTKYKVVLDSYKAELIGKPQSVTELCWASREDLQSRYPMPSGSAKIVEKYTS